MKNCQNMPEEAFFITQEFPAQKRVASRRRFQAQANLPPVAWQVKGFLRQGFLRQALSRAGGSRHDLEIAYRAMYNFPLADFAQRNQQRHTTVPIGLPARLLAESTKFSTIAISEATGVFVARLGESCT
jgi:hypothetical protein